MTNLPYRVPYSEALSAQLRFTALMSGPHFREWTSRMLSAKGIPADALEALAEVVRQGEPIFWSSECGIPPVDEMPEAFPDSSEYPTGRGFLWFEDAPIKIGELPEDPQDIPIRGFAWQAYKPFKEFQQPIALVPLTDDGPTGLFLIESRADVPIAEQGGANGNKALLNVALLFSHCMHFMGQRLVVDIQPKPANHDVRKQAKRLGIPAPDILVVQYRRREPSPTYAGAHTAVGVQEEGRWHYSVQFQVSGHWRLQPCGPGRSVIRRVWVREHLKGPQDAPITRPKKRLLAVVR